MWQAELSLGERIRKARESRGWLQKDLAVPLHVGRSTVANWENGVNIPTYAILVVIAYLTEVPFDWLIGDDVMITGSLTDGEVFHIDKILLTSAS